MNLLFVLKADGFQDGGLIEVGITLWDEFEHLVRRAETAIRREEDVDVSRFELAGIRGQGLDQLFQRAGLDESHTDSLPFQVWNIIFWILFITKKKLLFNVMGNIIFMKMNDNYADGFARDMVANFLQIDCIDGSISSLFAP